MERKPTRSWIIAGHTISEFPDKITKFKIPGFFAALDTDTPPVFTKANGQSYNDRSRRSIWLLLRGARKYLDKKLLTDDISDHSEEDGQDSPSRRKYKEKLENYLKQIPDESAEKHLIMEYLNSRFRLNSIFSILLTLESLSEHTQDAYYMTLHEKIYIELGTVAEKQVDSKNIHEVYHNLSVDKKYQVAMHIGSITRATLARFAFTHQITS